MIVMMPTLMIQILRKKRHTGSPARGDHNPENLHIKSFPLENWKVEYNIVDVDYGNHIGERWCFFKIIIVTLHLGFHSGDSVGDDGDAIIIIFYCSTFPVHSYETSFLNILIFFKNISAQFPEKLVKRIWRILQFRIFQSVGQASKDVDWVIVSQFDKIIPS